MKVCIRCFVDVEIKSIIETLNCGGICDMCGSHDFIYDTEMHTELKHPFNSLLERYTLKSRLAESFPSSLTVSIKSELKNNWNIFNELEETQIYEILISICSEKYSDSPEFFDDLVGVAELGNDKYLKENTLFYSETWEDFADELKYVTRFHSKKLNTEVLSDYLNTLAEVIDKDTVLLRGRTSDKEGRLIKDMGTVNPVKSKSGRANPKGIPYLYLANNIKTVLHELRVTKMNYATIAEFMLINNGIIIDLTKIDLISPFIFESEEMITLHIVNRNNLTKIHNEIIKPASKEESYLDYLPTQYIFDFIKKNKKMLCKSMAESESDEIIGVKFKSSLHSEGINYVFFEESIFEKRNPKVYQVTNVAYTEELVD